MKTLLSILCLAFVSLAAVSPAQAVLRSQDSPGSLALLLGVEKVRDAVGVTSLQGAILDTIRSEYRAAAQALFDPAPATPEARRKADAQLVQLTERYDRRALKVLNSSQRKKLRQVEFKALGGSMLVAPSVQKTLKLSEEQKGKIESIRLKGLEYLAKTNVAYEKGKINRFERQDRLRARRLKDAEAMLQVLSPEQQRAFASLSGTKA